MSIVLNILVFVLILGSIVFVHEFGHFIWAKWNGVYVYEFAIGMGPKLWSKKGKETEYSLRAVPIGGFCQLAGEDIDDDDIKKVPKEKRLQNKTAWQRFLIMFFGAGNNFIFAILLLFLIGCIWGGADMSPKVSGVREGYPAYTVGIEKGDTILKINNHKIETTDDIALFLAIADPKVKNEIEVKKTNNYIVAYNIKPKKVVKGKSTSYVYGLEMNNKRSYGLLPALKYTFQKTKSIFKQMGITVGYLFTGTIKLNQLSGPVGIYSIVGEERAAGIQSILYLIAFLSINVGFINLLPLPAFDGGHILFIIIEIIKGSPVNPKIENMIHTIGMFLLMGLMVYVTFNDIFRIFG